MTGKLYTRSVFLGDIKEVRINEFKNETKFIFADGTSLLVPETGDEFIKKYEWTGDPSAEDAPVVQESKQPEVPSVVLTDEGTE